MASVEADAAPETDGDDIRASLKAAYSEVMGREEAEPPAERATEPAAPEPTTSERTRDDRGRFASGGSEAPAEPAPAPATVAEQAPAEPATGQLEAAPNAWSTSAKAKWAELPPEVRQFVREREEQVHKEFSRRDSEREFGREVQRVVSPYEAMIRAEGGTPAAAISSLLNTAYVLRTGSPELKAQALRQIAQQFSVDIQAVAQPGQDVPPYVMQLQQELQSIKSERLREQQERERQAEAQLAQTINAFASDAKHTHFETVKPVMAALLQSGAAQDLEDAYSMAVWARPDLRTSLTATQQAAANTQPVKTQEAKRKSVASIKGGVGGTPTPSNPNRSLREDLAAAFEEQRGRV
jgi:hypothetical protein